MIRDVLLAAQPTKRFVDVVGGGGADGFPVQRRGGSITGAITADRWRLDRTLEAWRLNINA